MSSLDRKAKRLIPFWTFMSRNLPLQMQQQWIKPKSYAHYQSFVRQFQDDGNPDPDGVIPSYLQEMGGFSVGENLVAAPDLPMTRLHETAERIVDPKQLLADANPLLRVALETQMNHQMFKDRPFLDDENKWLYAALGTIPPLSTADRLSGGAVSNALGQDSSAEGRAGWNALGFLGVPVKRPSDRSIAYELQQRAKAAQR
jgi:hypothetical protein